MGLRDEHRLLQHGGLRQARRQAGRNAGRIGRAGREADERRAGSRLQRHVRHRHPRRPAMGDDPSRLHDDVFPDGRQRFRGERRRAEAGHEFRSRRSLPRQMGQDDESVRPRQLDQLLLVRSRHRPRRRQGGDDLRRRHPRLFPEPAQRQQHGRQDRLASGAEKYGRLAADQPVDLVPRHEPSRKTRARPGRSCNGRPARII